MQRAPLIVTAAVAAMLLSTFTGPLFAEEGAEEAVDLENIDDVEVVDSVDAVSANEGASETPFTLAQIIGRNHPATVHLPIGLMLGVLLLEVLALLFTRLPLGKSGLVLSIATLTSFIPAALSGWLRSQEVYTGEAPKLFFEHRNLMIGAAVVFTASLVLRLVKRDALDGKLRFVYLGLVVLSVLLIALGGHHGGQLVYGEGFLPY